MTDRIRVVQVVCTDVFAGVERYVTTLATGLSSRGCEVLVIGGSESRMRPDLEASGASWVAGPTPAGALMRLLSHRHVDVIHAHMTAAETASLLAAVAVRAPLVATRHFAQKRGSSPPARLMGRVVTRSVAAQLAISRYVADSIEGDSVVVPPGTPAPPDLSDPTERRPIVLVSQRLEPEKRTDLALEAWSHSGLAGRGWRLEVAGDGQERSRLEGLSASLGVADSVDFLGVRDDVGELQRRASILLAPRPDEPFGLSVVEAMAAGLPVVAAAGGGHMETVGLVEGAALYPPTDLAAAGRLLDELATDADRRRTYGEALRRVHRDHFGVDRQVDATLDVYRSVLKRSR